jgi:copper homeostasis protein
MNIIKEVCVESFDEAVRAVNSGANRIELCENLSVGGTTPSFGTIKTSLAELNTEMVVMIRPRGGNFNYSPAEFEIMKYDIQICKELGVKGVVFGILNAENEIDIERTIELVQLSRPMKVTFHKAIDLLANIPSKIEILKTIGIDRILSSGGKMSATKGKNILNQMIKLASPELQIIVAGKVTYKNLPKIMKSVPNNEYHGRKLVLF